MPGAENGTAENGVFSPSKILNDLGENTKKFGKEADQNIQNALKNTGDSMRNLAASLSASTAIRTGAQSRESSAESLVVFDAVGLPRFCP